MNSDTGEFHCSNADISGNIKASYGNIGPFNINNNELSAESGDDSLILNADLIRFLGLNSGVYIGGNVMPPSLGDALRCPSRFEVTRSASASSGYGNSGLYIAASGIYGANDTDGYQYTGNNAFYIPNGGICGFRLKARRLASSKTLSTMDSIIFDISSSSDSTYTLPTGCEDGQLFIIITATRYANIKASGADTLQMSTDATFHNSSTSISVASYNMVFLVYDKVNGVWRGRDVKE